MKAILRTFSGLKRASRPLLALALLMASLSALALGLDEAKARGLVGETVNGYLGAVESGPEVNALVAEINAKRKAEYQRIAQKNGIDLTTVEALAGKKAIDKTPAGQYVRIEGAWIKK